MNPNANPCAAQNPLATMRARIITDKIPICASLDLAHSCNLHCTHCYVRTTEPLAPHTRPPMAITEICHILDQLAEAGCLHLLITGGEPLIQPSFPDIYRYAKMAGFFVSVFTNATAVNTTLINLFTDLPPWSIEVSLYAATPHTYEQITGVKGSFDRCIQGIQSLTKAQVNLKIKTILMTLNAHEIETIRNIAASCGAPFHFDATIFPRLNGDATPLALRVNPTTAASLEFADPARATLWNETLQKAGSGPASDKLYLCGAGVTGCHITPTAQLLPCMMLPWIHYDLRTGPFKDGWKFISDTVANTQTPPTSPCRSCTEKNLCGYCPGSLRLETGSHGKKSDFFCSLAKARRHQLATTPPLAATPVSP